MTQAKQGEADLEIEHSLAFKRIEWRIQRVGWAVILLVMVAAVVGLFGVGPLSEASARADGYGSVHYERFLRYGTPTTVTVEAEAAALSDGTLQILLSSSFLSGVQVEQVTPEPDSVEASSEGYRYSFQAGEAPVRVEFRVKPNHIGKQSSDIQIGAGPPVTLTQFIYP